MTATITARATSTGDTALNMAMAAGFEVEQHFADQRRGVYVHIVVHADGRSLHLHRTLNTGRFSAAQGYNRPKWNTPRLSARSIPALQRLLAP
ncbi:hypothetical protein [Nonomuraea sp. GTA35]|uniref:hypothetical protein n=1 Tax=Nonomuraea sp. GTA35 TaxID=1676746 RepID=UPI0035BF0467